MYVGLYSVSFYQISALYVDHDVYRFLKPRKCSAPIHNLQVMRINEITYSFTFTTFPHSLPLNNAIPGYKGMQSHMSMNIILKWL